MAAEYWAAASWYRCREEFICPRWLASSPQPGVIERGTGLQLDGGRVLGRGVLVPFQGVIHLSEMARQFSRVAGAPHLVHLAIQSLRGVQVRRPVMLLRELLQPRIR